MSNTRIAWLTPTDPPDSFPPVESALREPDGLLAAGGDLSEERLLHAYRHGIFPWYEDGQPILWWCPDPRCVLPPRNFHVSRRFRQYIRQSPFLLTCNRAFDDVIEACAGRRDGQPGTWITASMKQAFRGLHRNGWAHSVEIWDGDDLVGGIYGLAMGRLFFGESMFHRADNASKFAMLGLTRILSQHDFALLDCQVLSHHLLTLGAEAISRREFSRSLENACPTQLKFTEWPDNPLEIAAFAPK